MEAYKTYNSIKKQHQEAVIIAQSVIDDFQRTFGYIAFPDNYDPFLKLFSLIENGFGEILWPVLQELNYCYEPEIQYMLANMDMRIRYGKSIYAYPGWRMFYSFEAIFKAKRGYILETKAGVLLTTPLLEYSEDKKIQQYASYRTYYGFCHDAVERFARSNPEYQIVTGLIPDQFGRKQYHSYLKQDGKVLDIAHGACIDEDNYNKIMKPETLNTLYGYELDEAEQKLDGNEIGPEKCLLVRLAVAKQRKM